MKMYPNDWRARLLTAVVIAACMGAAMILGPVVGIHGFWPGMFSIWAAILVGILLGNLMARRLFRPPVGGPPKSPPGD